MPGVNLKRYVNIKLTDLFRQTLLPTADIRNHSFSFVLPRSPNDDISSSTSTGKL